MAMMIDTVELDLAAIRAHLEMLHRLAEPIADEGKLVVASYGEDPDGAGAQPPRGYHFRDRRCRRHDQGDPPVVRAIVPADSGLRRAAAMSLQPNLLDDADGADAVERLR
jgi:hypothetical protein